MSSFRSFFPDSIPDVASGQIETGCGAEGQTESLTSYARVVPRQGKALDVVEANLEEQHSQIQLKKHVSMADQDLSEIQEFEEDSVFLRYRASEYEEDLQEEDQYDYCPYSTSSTLPPYFMMSRSQRVNYFDRLNQEYLRKMNPAEPNSNLNSNSDVIHPQTKRKPAIKFNDVVFEMPFGKYDQPKNVNISLQQQTQIRFDSAAYEMDEEEDAESCSEQDRKEFNQEESYFQEIDEFDFEDNVKTGIFLTSQKQDFESEESLKQESEKFPQNHEPSFSESPKIQQNIHLQELPFDEDEGLNVFKRDANRNFLSEASTSSDSNSSESSSSSEWRETDYNEEFESYFAVFLNGRKINPNAVENGVRGQHQH